MGSLKTFFARGRNASRASPQVGHGRRFTSIILGVSLIALVAPHLWGCGARSVKRPIETRYDTIAHEILDIELEHVRSADVYRRLDSIIRDAVKALNALPSSYLDDRELAVASFGAIAKVIEAHSFEYGKNGLLATALENGKIDCDGYSFLYLAVADAASLPIKMVRAPAHAFVRWQLADGEHVNWETTIRDEKPDEYYVVMHNIDNSSNGIAAMRSLDLHTDHEKILASAHVNCGVEWMRSMHWKEAMKSFAEAIDMDPYYEAPYYNKGLAYYHQGDMEKAIDWCKKALSLNPNHMKSHAVIGTAYMLSGDNENARKHFHVVKDLDPEYYSTKITEIRLTSSN